MKLIPYLVFNGQAEEALNFYAAAFDGRVGDLYRYDSAPDMPGQPPVPDEFKQRVMYACLAFDGGSMSISDAMPDDKADFGKGGHMLTLYFDSVAKIEEVYARLCVDAQEIRCKLGEAFFAKRYAEVYDRFGVLWALMVE